MINLNDREISLNILQWIVNIDLVGLTDANKVVSFSGFDFSTLEKDISDPIDFIQRAKSHKILLEVAGANDYDEGVFELICDNAIQNIASQN